jgi:hypothetical protein
MKSRALTIGGRIDRYVATLFLSSYATATLLVVGLFLVLDLASNLDEYIEPFKNGASKPWILIVRFYLLQIPFLFLQVGLFASVDCSSPEDAEVQRDGRRPGAGVARGGGCSGARERGARGHADVQMRDAQTGATRVVALRSRSATTTRCTSSCSSRISGSVVPVGVPPVGDRRSRKCAGWP